MRDGADDGSLIPVLYFYSWEEDQVNLATLLVHSHCDSPVPPTMFGLLEGIPCPFLLLLT